MAAPNAGQQKRTLYIGNLAHETTEQVLWTVFCQWGQITNCKVIRDPQAAHTPFAFIEYAQQQQAQMALSAMNHINFLGREIRVNWATSPGQGGSRADKGFHIFVGDILPELTDDELNDAFSSFGPMFDCKIIRYPDGKSRGYAFITFENESDATEAIAKMHGAWVGGKTCKCNWATKKPPTPGGDAIRRDTRNTSYESIFAEASLQNTTVYCGGVHDGLTEEFIKSHFDEYGQILSITIFADKGFAFIKYDSHDSATRAIFERNLTTLDGHVVRCSWGKEQTPQIKLQSMAPSVGPQLPVGYSTESQQQFHQTSFNGAPPGMMGPSFGGNFHHGNVGMPPYNNPGYDQYYNQYMDWYNKYGQQYYQQYYQQNNGRDVQYMSASRTDK